MTNIIQDLSLLQLQSTLLVSDDPTHAKEDVSSVDSPTTVAAGISSPSSTRRVHFGSTNTLVYQQFPSDFTDQEAETNVWYTQPQLDAIKTQNYVDLQARVADVAPACARLARGDARLPVEDDWTWRGFEYVLWRVARVLLRLQHAKDVVQSSKDRSEVVARESSETNGSTVRALKLGRTMEEDASIILGRPLAKYDSDDDDEEEDALVETSPKDDSIETAPRSFPFQKRHTVPSHRPRACMNVMFVRKVSKSA